MPKRAQNHGNGVRMDKTENLMCYNWPKNSETLYFVLEHVGMYLGVKSIYRKYPHITARAMCQDEKTHLRRMGFLSEYEMTMKIFACGYETVLKFMAEFFPDRFQHYIIHEKIRKTFSHLKNYSDCKKVGSVEELCETFNFLNKDRTAVKENVSILNSMNSTAVNVNVNRSVDNFDRMYKEYLDSYESIKSMLVNNLPVNVPTKKIENNFAGTRKRPIKKIAPKSTTLSPISNDTCDMCGSRTRPLTEPNAILVCASCEKRFHLQCMDIDTKIFSNMRRYDWHCMQCTFCIKCLSHEGDMLFCDNCDRACHQSCIMAEPLYKRYKKYKQPRGRWVCGNCGMCASCLKKNPEKPYYAEYTVRKRELLQIHCKKCHKNFKNGQYCRACLVTFTNCMLKKSVACGKCAHPTHKECLYNSKCLVCAGFAQSKE